MIHLKRGKRKICKLLQYVHREHITANTFALLRFLKIQGSDVEQKYFILTATEEKTKTYATH